MVRTNSSQSASHFTSRPKRNSRHWRLSRRYLLVILILSLLIFACTNISKSELSSVTKPPTDSRILKIWWDKGFNLEEDEALQQLVNKWEKQSGSKIKLSFYTADDLIYKTQRAVRAGNPPDILFSYKAERQMNPRFAWTGKLADVSDVLEPVKSLYPESILQAVSFYNNIDKKRSYYAIPILQATIHIFYWRDLIEQVGRSDSDIPQDWDDFWEFWKQVQDDLRSLQKQHTYGLGFPFSIGSADTYYFFEQILEAFDVRLLDSEGQLRVGDSKVKQKIVKILDWYAKFYQQGYVPPETVNWLDPDNNRNFLNRVVVMTPNVSLSIPSAVRQDPDTYYKKLGTLKFPNKPNGKPMRNVVALGQVVSFTNSKNQKLAKEFLAYLIQPQIIGDYLKAARRGTLPVLKPVLKNPFWTTPADPHLSTAALTLIEDLTRPFYYVQNPAYSVVLEKNVWGKALNRIVVDRISPEQAADEAIAQIKQIFAQWQ